MGKQTRKYIQELGKTGEGIMREEDVDLDADNHFVNKWSMWPFLIHLS